MPSDPISRPEFENALEGIRRELQAMSEHIGSDLAQIRAQLTLLLDTHHEEGREIGALTERVKHNEEALDALHQAHRDARSNRWVMMAGIFAALAGHLLTWMFRGAK